MYSGFLSRLSRPADVARAFVVVSGLLGLPPDCLSADSKSLVPSAAPDLQEVPERFTPAELRSAVEQRRLEAITLFATARSAQQQGELGSALRLYQRALRYDPTSPTIARAIVPLAFQLKRPAVAVRYALLAAELEEADPVLLRRLGIYLTEQGDWEKAVQLFERALQSRGEQHETTADILLRMELGRLYHLIDRDKMAADHFAKVLHAIENPKDYALDDETKKVLLGDAALTYELMGDCFSAAGRPKEALAAYEKANKAKPQPGRYQVNCAGVYLQEEKPEKALASLETAFRNGLETDDARPFVMLISTLRRLNREDDILPRLEALLEMQEDQPALRLILAEQYREAGKFDEAAKQYDALRQISPSLISFRGLAETYRRSGQVELLLRVLAELADKTGTLDALGSEGKVIAGDTDLLGELIELVRKRQAEEDGKLDFGTAIAVAILSLEGGRFEAAGDCFEAAVAARPEAAAELFVLWGVGLLVSDEPAMAVRVFRRAIQQVEHAKSRSLFHCYLAGALELDRRTDEALAAARKAVDLAPDVPRFHARIGWVLHHAGRNREAIEAYRRMIKQFDDDHNSPDTRDALRQARLILSSLYVVEGDLDEAESWLEEILDEFPGDPGAMNDLGYLWADQGEKLDLALEMIEQAVAAEPENSAFRDSLGWVYYRLGRYGEAVVELEKAVGLDEEPDPTILDHLGDALLRNDQTDKARDAWQRAVEAFRKADEAAKADAVEKKLSPLKK